MRNLHDKVIDQYRVRSAEVRRFYGGIGDDTCGVFEVPSRSNSRMLFVIASAGEGWDHVSVSLKKRPPSWMEMEQIKRLFFLDTETAMQLHVPPTDHISIHDNCLHLWRPHDVEIPRPPAWMVGKKTAA